MHARGASVTKLPLVTNSECTCARRCAREHCYAYTLGVRPVVTADPLYFGIGIHLGLARYWNGGELTAPLEEYIDAFERERAHAMLDGYGVRWASDRERYETVAVEVQFTAPLINPATGYASTAYRLGGRIDAIVRDRRDFSDWIVEHKTTSEDIGAGSPYWARLRLDSQISLYMVGARALGFEPRGVIYDVLGKPLQRPSSAVPVLDESGCKIVRDGAGERVRTKDGRKWRETADADRGYVLQTRDETPEEYGARVREAIAAEPERYYARGEVVRLAEEEIEAAADTWQIVGRIRDARRTGVAPRNPDACFRWNRPCPYFPVCTGETTLENPQRYRRLEHVHPELDREDEAA